MAWPPKEIVEKQGVKPGTIAQGHITAIEEGKWKDFVSDFSKWKNPNPDGLCIQVNIKVEHSDIGVVGVQKLIGYNMDESGQKMVYTTKSNMGRYVATYGGVPKVLDQVNVIADDKGFFRLVLN